MIVPNQLRQNKLRQVNLPSPSELFAKYGYKSCTQHGNRQDEFGDPVNLTSLRTGIDDLDVTEKTLLNKARAQRDAMQIAENQSVENQPTENQPVEKKE